MRGDRLRQATKLGQFQFCASPFPCHSFPCRSSPVVCQDWNGWLTEWLNVARLLRADLGAAGSGSPVHWHNDAINVAVQGAKLWTLLPPPQVRC